MKKSSEKGSITLYVLVSMLLFMTVATGLYVASSNKLRRQNRELDKIQREYSSEDINNVYKKAIGN